MGSRQHRWMYGGEAPFSRAPYRFRGASGKPPAVLRGLVAQGLMWAHRIETRSWMPSLRLGD